MTLFVTILQLLCGLVVILAVLFQSGKSAGLSGAIGGVAEIVALNEPPGILGLSLHPAVKLRLGRDIPGILPVDLVDVDQGAKLAKATKWIGAVFIVLTLVLNVMSVRG